MLGAIAGDIIGSRFEGRPGPPPDFELFHRHCRFTDDTVCSLAIADAIMRKAGSAAGSGEVVGDWSLPEICASMCIARSSGIAWLWPTKQSYGYSGPSEQRRENRK